MTKNKSLLKEFSLFILLLIFCLSFMLTPNSKNLTLNGIKLWVGYVLPTLFPYLFISTALSSLSCTGKLAKAISPLTKGLFNVGGGGGFAFLISIISGYPIGSKTLSDLYKKGALNKAEGVRASILCSTCSPVFLITTVGAITFNDATFGILLFFSHLLSSFLLGFAFSFYKRNEKPKTVCDFSAFFNETSFYDGVKSATLSVLTIGGIITLFYIITELLLAYNVLAPIIKLFSLVFNDNALGKGFALGLFECTKGIKIIATTQKTLLCLPTVAFLSGFGGVSIIMQSTAYLKNAKIKTAPFILSKIVGAIINFVIALIFSLLFY